MIVNRRLAMLALPLAFALTAAGPAPKKAVPAPPIPDLVKVQLVTAAGPIELELDHKHAPLTVENFLRYVDQRRLDGTVFYRSMKLAWGTPPNGLIQGGTQMDPKRLLKPVAHEPTSLTGLSHKAGAISLARGLPGTGTADFSIMLSDLTGLDADPKSTNPDTQAGYAVFGRVSAGMEVVRKIWEGPTSPTKGVGSMKGQMLEPTVKILTARRVAAPVAPK